MNNSKGKKKAKSTKKGKKSGISSTSLVYTGPIRTVSDKQETQINTIVLVEDAAVNSSSGNITSTFAFLDPSGCVDWANAIAVWDEYRVLGLEVVYTPNSANALNTNSAALLYAPIYTVIDRDSNSALTSYAQAANYASMQTHVLDQKFSTTYKMKALNTVLNATAAVGGEGVFLSTQKVALVTNSGCIKWFASGLTTAGNYGRVTAYYRIQFRGKGI